MPPRAVRIAGHVVSQPLITEEMPSNTIQLRIIQLSVPLLPKAYIYHKERPLLILDSADAVISAVHTCYVTSTRNLGSWYYFACSSFRFRLWLAFLARFFEENSIHDWRNLVFFNTTTNNETLSLVRPWRASPAAFYSGTFRKTHSSAVRSLTSLHSGCTLEGNFCTKCRATHTHVRWTRPVNYSLVQETRCNNYEINRC